MSLDIGVGDGTTFISTQGLPSLHLEDDGYYWFLHPLFEQLRDRTGEYIDLYGDASFAGAALAAMGQMLREARAAVASQPDEWKVCVGTEVSPRTPGRRHGHRGVYRVVHKRAFLALLDSWRRVVTIARRLGRPVVCFGD